MSLVHRGFLTALALAWGLAAPRASTAASFQLDLVANGDGIWVEFFSDAFAQINAPFNGSQVPDGFFQFALFPSLVQIGASSGADVFPNESNFFDVGSLEFDDSGLAGGTGTAPVTSLVLDFDRHVADNDSVSGIGYATQVSNLSGSVSVFAGEVTGIDLTADIRFVYDVSSQGFGILNYDGSFSITDDRWDLFVDDSNPSGPAFERDFRYIWDLEGGVSNLATAPVPEPAPLATALSILLGIGLLKTQRRG